MTTTKINSPEIMTLLEKARRVKSCSLIAETCRSICDACGNDDEYEKIKDLVRPYTNAKAWSRYGADYMHKEINHAGALALDELYEIELA